MGHRWLWLGTATAFLLFGEPALSAGPAKALIPETLVLQRRAVVAAEASSIAAHRSAEASKRSADAAVKNADTAAAQVWWTRWGVIIANIALFGPYLLLLWQRALNRRSAREAAQSAIEASNSACRRARDNNLRVDRQNSEIWPDLTALSVARNVVDVQLRRGEAGHALLLGLSNAYQTNFAVRDALQMRLAEANPRNLPLSNVILEQLEERISNSLVQPRSPNESTTSQ